MSTFNESPASDLCSPAVASDSAVADEGESGAHRPGLSPVCPFCHKTVEQLIEDQLASGPKSAQQITTWLRNTGHMPALWTVIDVADFLREWFSSDTGATR